VAVHWIFVTQLGQDMPPIKEPACPPMFPNGGGGGPANVTTLGTVMFALAKVGLNPNNKG